MPADLTGRTVGHYRVDGVIGRGGMSTMYRATDVRLGRTVALKIIAEHLTGDEEFRQRFVEEARNTSAIDHSHVVPLYDFGDASGWLFIAMRYVEGPDLASLISAGPLTPARGLSLLGQVSEALDSVHERGLVHLDVKPANVLVTTKESALGEHVYLADFGLTRRGATGHRTTGGDFLGSPTYAAPEHLRGEPVDPRTDRYSMGCLLFACLSGRAPFRGSVQEVIQGHLNEPVPALSEVVELPPTVDHVVRRAMSKQPAERFHSCREMVFAARSALGSALRNQSPPRRLGPAEPASDAGSGPSGSVGSGPSGPVSSGSGPSGPVPAEPSMPDGARFPDGTGRAGTAPPGERAPTGPSGPIPPQHPSGAQEPRRLRDPVPAQHGFSNTRGAPSARGALPEWVLPTAIAVIALLVLAVILLVAL